MVRRGSEGASSASASSAPPPKRARLGDSDEEDDVDDANAPAEWEFDFGDEIPDAEGLLELAVEEKSDGNAEAAVRLFELALEAFQKESEEKNKAAKEDVEKFRFQWATCLRELGEYLPLREYLEDAIKRFEELAGSDHNLGNDVNIALARSHLGLAQTLRESANKLARRLEDELDSEDAQQDKVKLDESETAAAENLKTGTELYNKAIGAVPAKFPGRIASECSVFARYLTNYASAVNTDARETLIKDALALTDRAIALKPRDDFVLSVRSSCLLSSARHAAHNEQNDIARKMALEALGLFEAALTAADEDDRHVDTLKGLADTYLLLATLEESEESVLSYFDKARQRLKEALEISPGFDEAREQLEALGGAEEEEESK